MAVRGGVVEATSERDGDGSAGLDAHVPRLASEWRLSGDARPWRILDGTLVFADISGFTALSERLAKQGPIGAEELTEVLGACFAELLRVAYARGGSLVKFGGDALLLLFDGDDHPGRGVAAALGMRAAMRDVGRLVTSVGNVRLRMSVGVHAGELHAFRVGGSHAELLLAGPGASTVVAMEGAADAGEIVVSPATAAAIDPSLLGPAKGPGVLLRNRAIASTSPPGDAFPARRDGGDTELAVPVALRQHLLAGGGASEHRHASIAFLHFDGTDGLLAEHGPHWLADALDELVRAVQESAERHGVTFLASDLDHDGGKIILVGGVPRMLGDDEGRLLRAVQELVDEPRRIRVRAGINRGPVFAGEVGPHYRRTFTVMGDAVNLAARLMAKAEPGEVLASAGVLERSRTAFEVEPLPPFLVKGKSRPVEAFVVGAPRGTQDRRRASTLPLTGRDKELAVLEEALASARVGGGRVVEVVGPVGVGKTRLVEELRFRVEDVAARVVSCEQYEQATPFFAFRVLLRAVLGLRQPTPEALREAALALDPELEPWLPLLGDVVGVVVPETEASAALAPQFRRTRANVVAERVLALKLTDPTVLVFDDTQWMDGPSAELLAKVVRAADARPWLVCTTRRDEPGGYAADEDGPTTRVILDPLDAAASADLVRAATTDLPLPPHRVAAIIERAGGNPLFLEELVATSSGDDVELPDSLEALICAHVDRLSPGDGRLLRVAAVLGSSFEVPLLVGVVDPDDAATAEALAVRLSSLDDHLVRERDGRVRFRHRLIRDVAYELLPFRRRQELHLRAARTIEATAGDAAAEALVLHFHHAQQYPETWHYGCIAGGRALAKNAPIESMAHYERALVAARRLPELTRSDVAHTWEQLSVAANLGGFYDRAKAALRAARQLRDDDPVSLADLCFREARLADRHSRSQDVIRWVRRGLKALDGRDDDPARKARAALEALYAYTRQQGGKPREAIEWARKVVEGADADTSSVALAQAYLVLDWAHIDLGCADLAVHAPRAIELLEAVGEHAELAVALNNLGAFAYFQGRWHDALDLYRRATATFDKIGDVVDAGLGTSNQAEIFTHQGRLDEAEALLQQTISLWRSMSFPLGLAMANRHLGRVRLRQDRLDEALDLFADAHAVFAGYGLSGKVIEVDAWVAECLLRRGELDRAVELVEDALRREHAGGGTEMAPMLHRLAGYAAAAQGRLVDAWAALDLSLHVARGRGASYDVALALEGMSVVAELGGPTLEEGHDDERRALLDQLGVRVAPAPPLVLSA